MSNELKSRRRTPRRKIDAKIGILLKGEFCLAKCLQIGEGGILLATHLPVEVKQKYLISVIIPLEGMVIGRIEILYEKSRASSTAIYGCQFFELDFRFKKIVRSYVSQKTELEGDEELVEQALAASNN